VYLFVNFFWIIMIIIIQSRVITGEPHTCLLTFLNYHDYNWKCSLPTYRIKTMAPRTPEKMLCLMLQCWLCSTHYTAVWINEKNLCNQSSHYENNGQFLLQIEAIMCVQQNLHFSWWAKMNGRALVSPRTVHFMNSGASKAHLGTTRHQTVKKIKSIALAIIELRFSEGIRQLVS